MSNQKIYANSRVCNSHCRSATRGYVRMRYLCVTDFFSGGNSCVPSVASEQVRATNSRFCSQPNSCVPSVARATIGRAANSALLVANPSGCLRVSLVLPTTAYTPIFSTFSPYIFFVSCPNLPAYLPEPSPYPERNFRLA